MNHQQTTELQRLTQIGLQSVESDPARDLNLQLRRKILCALGEENESRSGGHAKRIQLQMLAVQHVLFLWDEVFPGDDTPRSAIAIAQAHRDGKLDEATSMKNARRFWTHCDNLL